MFWVPSPLKMKYILQALDTFFEGLKIDAYLKINDLIPMNKEKNNHWNKVIDKKRFMKENEPHIIINLNTSADTFLSKQTVHMRGKLIIYKISHNHSSWLALVTTAWGNLVSSLFSFLLDLIRRLMQNTEISDSFAFP